MLLSEIGERLHAITQQKWSSVQSTKVQNEDLSCQSHRWIHQASNRGFVLLICTHASPLSMERLRRLIKWCRNWQGSNIGCFILPLGGVEAQSGYALPSYGYLRVAVLDVAAERILYGSDSPRFHVLISAMADLFGIPPGSKSAVEIRVRQSNQLGPSLWKRESITNYEQEGKKNWHPLVVSAKFPQLSLSLEGVLYDEHRIFLLAPYHLGVTTYRLTQYKNRFVFHELYLLSMEPLTQRVMDFATEHNIIVAHIQEPFQYLENLGYVSVDMTAKTIEAHCWGAYLSSISPVSNLRFVDQAVLCHQCCYLAPSSSIALRKMIHKLPKNHTLVLYSNFHVEEEMRNLFAQCIWIYRGEIYRRGTLPMAIQNAFFHFYSFESPLLYPQKWQERFMQGDHNILDRITGLHVEIIKDVPYTHPWIMHASMLSWLHYTTPVVFYDRNQEVLVLQKEGEERPMEVSQEIKRHLLMHFYLLGISFEERGAFSIWNGETYMSLIHHGDWRIPKKDRFPFDRDT